MALSNDQNYLLVGHNDSQYVTVYDLNAMARLDPPVILPGGHYARSIAASNSKLLVLARNEANGSGIIDSVDLLARTAAPLQTLGIFKNSVSSRLRCSPRRPMAAPCCWLRLTAM